MSFTQPARVLSHHGVLAMLAAAVAEAERIGQPQCIVIVDASGVTLGALRMTGAKFLSLRSARAKAQTSASTGAPSSAIPAELRPLIGLATEGAVTGLPGGLPIRLDGVVVGGLGIGSGTGDRDVAVARAALAAVGADT